MRRSFLPVLLLPLVVAGCAVPGRPKPSPYAGAPALVDVAALSKFDGSVPLVRIPEHTPDWGGPVKYAVNAALKVNPKATFRVYLTGPVHGGPASAEREMARLAPEAAQVANAIVADGVPAERVSIAASAPLPHVRPPAAPEILVFAK